MLFNPKEINIKFFTHHICIITAQEGPQPVLDMLPFYLKEQALEWHTELDKAVHLEMISSITAWYMHLEQEFQANPIIAKQEADWLKFTFAKANTLCLSKYLTKKITLICTAGMTDPEAIKIAL